MGFYRVYRVFRVFRFFIGFMGLGFRAFLFTVQRPFWRPAPPHRGLHRSTHKSLGSA